MDTEVLVENRIEDGRKLIAELVFFGFDVSVALWAKTSDEGLWSLYIGSTFAEPSNVGDAYRKLFACLEKIPDAWIDLSEVKSETYSSQQSHRQRSNRRVTVNLAASLSVFGAIAWET